MALRSFRQFVKDYFTFSRRHRRYTFALLLIMLALFGIQYGMRFLSRPEIRFGKYREDILAFEKQLSRDSATREMAAKAGATGKTSRAGNRPMIAPVRVAAFNPNTAHDSVWRQLGFSPRVIRHIRRYLDAGGRFRKKEDLRKIYGLDEADYRNVEGLLSIPPDTSRPRAFHAPREAIPPVVFDLNTVTADELQSIRGIGEVRARSILSYRSRLGGFTDTRQLLEAYGIDSAVYETIRHRFELNVRHWGAIDINADNLKGIRHPYLTERTARLIENYRKMHGPYRATEELKAIEGIRPADLERLLPYLVAR